MKTLIRGRFMVILFLGLLLIVGCSKETAALKQKEQMSESDKTWTEGLSNGVYFKQLGDREGIVYVNLKKSKIEYTKIDVQVSTSGEIHKLLIEEQAALNDSEVKNEYIGILKTKDPLKQVEAYLNGKKVDVTVMQNYINPN